jgi:outer membrane immunogenic protein
MNRLVLGLAAGLALTVWLPQGASAADMPVKAPTAPPLWSLTGFYAGLNGGYSWGRSSTDVTVVSGGTPSFSLSENMNGWVGGGQVGYNFQFNRSWLLGIEADIQGTGQKGTVPVTAFAVGSGSLTQELPWFGTVRARLGVEPADHALLYVTGGLAYAGIKSTAMATSPGPPPATVVGTFNNTAVGWTIGVGAEWWLRPQWSVKAEYLYMDFASFGFAGLAVGGTPANPHTSHVTDNIFRVGVNFHLGGPMLAGD